MCSLKMPTLSCGDHTESVKDFVYFGEPTRPRTPEDMAEGIRQAMQMEAQPIFLEGLARRLSELGIPCSPSDTDIMLREVKVRYRQLLGKPCPHTVQDWIRKGTPPGVTSRHNHYELCYALEMDYMQTREFFQKHYLTMPFNVKSRCDAVFMYTLCHHKPYSVAADMLAKSQSFQPAPCLGTHTAGIMEKIRAFSDDAAFILCQQEDPHLLGGG